MASSRQSEIPSVTCPRTFHGKVLWGAAALLAGIVGAVSVWSLKRTSQPAVAAPIGEPAEIRQQRGKQIYLTGTSQRDTELIAVLGNSKTEVPAAVLTCVNCHRYDGRGVPEGGIYPSDIAWQQLSKPYGIDGPQGTTRPPYDEAALIRAISMGIDPAGRRLNDAMPRYRMAPEDMSDLIAYLKILGTELDPGVTDEAIRIGVVLAPPRLFPEMNQAARSAITAYVKDVNRRGGVYQRQLDIRFLDAPERMDQRADAVLQFVRREQVFALASSFIAGAESDLCAQLAKESIPLVGAETLYPQTGFPLNRFVFYLTSGLHGQVCALLNFSFQRGAEGESRVALLYPDDDKISEVAQDVQDSTAGTLCMRKAATGGIDAADLVTELRESGISQVISLLPPDQNLVLLQAAAGADWFPEYYVVGPISGPQLFYAPQPFDQRIFLSFPVLPSRQPAGLQEFSRLAQTYQLSADQLAVQFEAIAGVKTLVEGLQRSGTRISRQRFVDELESLSGHRTGFSPPITFGPNRRVGAPGAHIATIDLSTKKLMTVCEWIDGVLILQRDRGPSDDRHQN